MGTPNTVSDQEHRRELAFQPTESIHNGSALVQLTPGSRCPLLARLRGRQMGIGVDQDWKIIQKSARPTGWPNEFCGGMSIFSATRESFVAD